MLSPRLSWQTGQQRERLKTRDTERSSEDMEDDDKILQETLKWLKAIVQGAIGQELETRAVEGLRIIKASKGFIRSNFIVTSSVSDVDGNWHVGAIATLIDIIGAVAIYTVTHRVLASVDCSISYYSTAKIQEDVEIDAKVLTKKGKLAQVTVEVRRKGNGELIALGKQWMWTFSSRTFSQMSKL